MSLKAAAAKAKATSAARSAEPVSVELAGTTGTATSKVYVGGPAETLSDDDLLRGWMLDPDEWEITPDTLRVNRWQQRGMSDYDDAIWCYQYKASVRKRTTDSELADLPPLVRTEVKVRTVRKKRVATDLACAVVFPDAQISYWRGDDEAWRTTHDEAALDISLQVLADVEAEHGVTTVVDLGDFLDCTHMSRHRSAPSQVDRLGFKRSVARGQQELAARTALTPNATRHLIPGNHENRINLWLTDNAPFLMGLTVDDTDPVLSLEWLLQTRTHGWEVADAYPEGVVWLNDNTRCIHGWVAKGVPGASAAEYLKDECNTIFGHTPRAQTVQRTVARHGNSSTYVAHTAGGLMRVDGAVPSGSTGIRVTGDPVLARGEKWDQGLSVIFYDPEGTTVPFIETVPIFGGRAVWRGRVYTASCDADGNAIEEVAA
jgi:hypothetical protein